MSAPSVPKLNPLLISTLLFMSINASAFTTNRCESADKSKTVVMLFDAADNYFINALLYVGSDQTNGKLLGKDRIRPRPEIDPNHPLLRLAFKDDIFVYSLDGTSATLTSSSGVTESMVCCIGHDVHFPCL